MAWCCDLKVKIIVYCDHVRLSDANKIQGALFNLNWFCAFWRGIFTGVVRQILIKYKLLTAQYEAFVTKPNNSNFKTLIKLPVN